MNKLILIDKPRDWTSHDVCQKCKRLLHISRIGHTGTLDPMATGLMLVCVGEATKYVKYLTEHDKTYIAEVAFGIKTNTDDITGEILQLQQLDSFDTSRLDEVLHQLVGAKKQLPPAYSAIKVAGKKLYEYARKNQEMPVVEPRDIVIYQAKRLSNVEFIDGFYRVSLELSVSKGTYIRSIASEIGYSLGTIATLSGLRRTKVGNFHIDDALTLEQLEQGNHSFVDPIVALGLPVIQQTKELAAFIEHGSMIDPGLFPSIEDTIIVDDSNQIVAIYTYDALKNKMRVSVKLHASDSSL
jgi:tRNA pseudouridine55 synthase